MWIHVCCYSLNTQNARRMLRVSTWNWRYQVLTTQGVWYGTQSRVDIIWSIDGAGIIIWSAMEKMMTKSTIYCSFQFNKLKFTYWNINQNFKIVLNNKYKIGNANTDNILLFSPKLINTVNYKCQRYARTKCTIVLERTYTELVI